MSADLYEKIDANPKFHQLITKRSQLAWGLSSVIFIVYFSFILLIAFAPELLGKPVYAGSLITVGIPVGVIIISISFILTGIYVWKANKDFDRLNQEIVSEAQK